ncbi:hypothetical protein ABQE93_11755 [Mycolicibacterium sp. XJ662]
MRTTFRYLTPVFAAGGLAAAMLLAPAAAAQGGEEDLLPKCVDTGGAAALGGSDTECATPGNVSIDATPAEVGPWGDMWGGEGFFFP